MGTTSCGSYCKSLILSWTSSIKSGSYTFEEYVLVYTCIIYQIGLQLSSSPAFQRDQLDSRDFLLIIQCDSGDSDGDLIACARYRIYDEGVKSVKQNSILECEGNTHVLFVIHIPQQSVHSSFVGFQGDPWVSAHIDDLRHKNSDTVTLSEAMNMPISHLFIRPDSKHEVSREREQTFMEIVTTKAESSAEDEDEEMQADESMDDANKNALFETEPSIHPQETIQLPEPEILEHISEPAEPRMEGSIAEQPQLQTSDQQLAQPHFQPKPKALKKSGYYFRLHGCIQAAASRLQDSAKNKERATDRVKLLMDLIPSSPALNLGRLISPVTKYLYKYFKALL